MCVCKICETSVSCELTNLVHLFCFLLQETFLTSQPDYNIWKVTGVKYKAVNCKYLEKKRVITSSQQRPVKIISLVSFFDMVTSVVDDRYTVDIIYLDLSKLLYFLY